MFTSMRSVKNIRANVKYPITDKEDQDKHGERVEGAIFGGGLIDTGDAATLSRQFEYFLNRAGRRHRKDINGEYPIQGWIKIVSFSENEISPDDPEGAEKALEIVQTVQDNLAPDCLWMAVAQKDGEGGKWHVHIVQNAVHSSTLKAMTGRETNYNYFKEHVEAAAVDMGITLDPGKNHKKRNERAVRSQAKHEGVAQKDGYSWMLDLQDRILKAVLATIRASDYEANLNINGVTVARKAKSGWTYQLAACDDERFVGKRARYDKFNTEVFMDRYTIDFSQPMLNKVFEMNYRKKKRDEGALIAKGLDPRTGRRLPDISNVKGIDGYDLERRD